MSIRQRPGERLSGLAIDDLDTLCVGHVDEDAWTLRFDLKPFRMPLQLVFRREALVGDWIDHRNGAVAVPKVDLFRGRVIAQIIRVGALAKVDRVKQRKCCTVIDGYVAVCRIGDEELVPFREIQGPLGLGESIDLVDQPACEHIDDLHRVVTEAGENHAFALGIDREVIEATLYSRQRDLLHLAHRRCLALLAMGNRSKCGKRADAEQGMDQNAVELHGWMPHKRGFQKQGHGTASNTRSSALRSWSRGTATYNRCHSGTKTEVRASGPVGMCAMRS